MMSDVPPWNPHDILVLDDFNPYVDDDERPIWPPEGMACDVSACSTPVFNTYRKYRKHWSSIHLKFNNLYKCPSCGFRATERFHVTQHLRKCRKSNNTSVLPIKVTQENPRYIDPGNVLPRKNLKMARTAERDEAQRQRQSVIRPLSFDNVDDKTPTVSRDQEAILDRGHLVIKDKKSWKTKIHKH